MNRVRIRTRKIERPAILWTWLAVVRVDVALPRFPSDYTDRLSSGGKGGGLFNSRARFAGY